MPCAAVEGRFAVDTGGIVAGGFVEMSVPIGVPAPAAPALQGIFRVGIMGSDIHGENREEGVRTKLNWLAYGDVGIRTGIGASAPFQVGIFGGPAFGNTTVTTDIHQSRTQGGWSAGAKALKMRSF